MWTSRSGVVTSMVLAAALMMVARAGAQLVPPVTVYVRQVPASNGVTYRYRVVNQSNSSITAVSIGYDYYHGVPELASTPMGWDLSSGIPRSSVTSPDGWVSTLVASGLHRRADGTGCS